jgi:hypothetical protein
MSGGKRKKNTNLPHENELNDGNDPHIAGVWVQPPKEKGNKNLIRLIF